MADWKSAVAYALTKAAVNQIAAIAKANDDVVAANNPSQVTRSVDGVVGAPDTAILFSSAVVFSYLYMSEVVEFALETLKARSPVGSAGDKHPDLYRESHMVFLNGHLVQDVSGWRPGDQINISNDVPYARKIEAGTMKMSVPGHVYEESVQIVQGRFGNRANIQFVYMPVVFGSVNVFANSAAGAAFAKSKRGGSPARHPEWLSRQPAMQITAR